MTGAELKQLRDDLSDAIERKLTAADMARLCALPEKGGADTIQALMAALDGEGFRAIERHGEAVTEAHARPRGADLQALGLALREVLQRQGVDVQEIQPLGRGLAQGEGAHGSALRLGVIARDQVAQVIMVAAEIAAVIARRDGD